MMKTKSISWESKYYNSTEHCNISIEDNQIDIRSSIAGQLEDDAFKVEYTILTNANWETVSFNLVSEVNDVSFKVQGWKTGDTWSLNGTDKPDMVLCTDIDITLTPFTNSLPINRLHLKPNESRQIDVLYINILEQTITKVKQKYTRLSETKYKFENVPNDFEAVIQVDDTGFVVHYPELFDRT